MSETRWFYLKVGKSSSLAKEWLSGANPLKRPAVPIFFGRCSIADLRAGNCDKQAKHFYESSLPENRDLTVITVVGQGNVWFLKPSGELKEHDPSSGGEKSESTWKMMPVDFLLKNPLALKDVPPVLAGINANAYLGRGTYREMGKSQPPHWGNIKAVECVLGHALPAEHLTKENCGAPQLLECLSSVELETLVAKLFEAAGCFVPAYRGGCVQYVDLFAHNDTSQAITLEKLSIPPKGRLAIQVKGWQSLGKCPDEVDCLIGFEAPDAPNCFNGDWLLNQVKRFPTVLAWLKRSLDWLPSEFLSNYAAYGF